MATPVAAGPMSSPSTRMCIVSSGPRRTPRRFPTWRGGEHPSDPSGGTPEPPPHPRDPQDHPGDLPDPPGIPRTSLSPQDIRDPRGDLSDTCRTPTGPSCPPPRTPLGPQDSPGDLLDPPIKTPKTLPGPPTPPGTPKTPLGPPKMPLGSPPAPPGPPWKPPRPPSPTHRQAVEGDAVVVAGEGPVAPDLGPRHHPGGGRGQVQEGGGQGGGAGGALPGGQRRQPQPHRACPALVQRLDPHLAGRGLKVWGVGLREGAGLQKAPPSVGVAARKCRPLWADLWLPLRWSCGWVIRG